MVGRRLVLALSAAFACVACGGAASVPVAPPTPTPTPTPSGPPNILLILADDLGYGDLSSYGHPQIKTPVLDRLAAEGVRFTSFYVPAPVCAPSPAGLMTGRWPVRTGIPWNPPVRLYDEEITIADALHARGYATSMLGKWHLGWYSLDMPTHHGFDSYYGIPAGEDGNDFWRGDQITKDTVGLDMLARKYLDEASTFVRSVGNRPFFLYIAHRTPHATNFASDLFLGKSGFGIYGDAIEEMDWTTGELLKVLHETGQDQNLLVFFASDNGPALGEPGTARPLSGAKGSCLEGGIRVPGIAWWPGKIPPGRVLVEPASTLDLFPTFLALAGGALPTDRKYDGQDITKLLTGELTKLPGPGVDGSREFLFWFGPNAVAVRSGKWKYLRPGFWSQIPALYDLEADPGEQKDLSKTFPDMADRLSRRFDEILGGG